MRMWHRFRKTGVGQSLVEFALIGPVFLLLVFGIIEGGRLLWTFHTLSNAAKEGARYTTVRGSGSTLPDAPATGASIKSYVLTKSTGLNGDDLNMTLVLVDGDMDDQSRFRVEASYEHQFIVTAIFGINSITLEADSTDIFWREPDD
jgi:Flp pilus assembly protein TadG